MGEIEYAGTHIKIDDDGYLINFNDWNENVAHVLAEREGIEDLTQDRLDILNFIRQYYQRWGTLPVFGAVCLNISQPKECVERKFLHPVQAWKIAGIPNPGKEIETYLHHEVV
jgi:TusE/DsrC/DsvC family sulfur relay protein